MSKRLQAVLMMIGMISFSAASCMVFPAESRVRSHSEDVSLEGAQTVQVEILMGAGELEIGSGTELLLEGDFSYSSSYYAPDLSYRVRDGEGILQIEQDQKPGIRIDSGYRNEWDLNFNDQVPLAIDLTLGAGASRLDLSGLNLSDFSLQLGAGEAYINLDGNYRDDLNIEIQGGVGELTLILPSDMIIEAEINGGLGEVNASGLYREGGRYLSQYSGSGPVLSIQIDGGIGQVNLLAQ